MSSPRPVVTGMGLMSPLGHEVAPSWEALRSGGQARSPLVLFDVEGCRCRDAAAVSLPDDEAYKTPVARYWPRATRLALPAAREALRQAGLLDEKGQATLPVLPLSLSTTGGGMEWGEEFWRRASAGKKYGQLALAARYQPQQQAMDLQQYFGFSGSVMIVANACASGANAVGHAGDLIRAGLADCVLAGGFEALSELIYVGFDCLQALSPENCRPFDLDRSGLMLGEGAGFLVIESEEHARARDAAVLAELRGYGHSTDLHHLTQPSPDGNALVRAMKMAGAEAGLAPESIAYVNAHGTATPMNDGTEVAAYVDFFGPALGGVRISSTKAAVGHTLGAAGAVEAIFSLCALREGVPPPQLNCRNPIPEIAAVLAAPHDRLAEGQSVMSVNLGFGGSNAALIFSRYEA